MRNESTLSEVLLWNELKSRKLLGYQFLRQKPVSNYILDFFCKELNLAIEIDGSSHNGKEQEDTIRQLHLENMGVVFIRVGDLDVKTNLNGVIIVIKQEVTSLGRNDHSLQREN